MALSVDSEFVSGLFILPAFLEDTTLTEDRKMSPNVIRLVLDNWETESRQKNLNYYYT